ncbi:MAG TPA: beta/gamma crystallin-related protein [Parvibaculum sp.]
MRIETICRALAVAASLVVSFAPIAAKADTGIVLYQDSNFNGRGVGVTGDARDLGRFNDAASSVHVNGGRWLLCEHVNFEGRCITIDRDVRDLGQLGFNDKVSSIRRVDDRRDHDGRDRNDRDGRYGGRRGDVEVFADGQFGGESKVFSNDIRDFSGSGFNDRISSISVYRGTWQFCEKSDYRGRCITVSGDVSSLGNYGLNDKISSMRRVR